jgi:hypothetical protein
MQKGQKYSQKGRVKSKFWRIAETGENIIFEGGGGIEYGFWINI